jgi:acetyl esterase
VPLDPDLAAFIGEVEGKRGRPVPELTIPEARAGMRALRVDSVRPEDVVRIGAVTDEVLDELPVRVYRPAAVDGPVATVVYLHGGGWFRGDVDTHDQVVRRLVRDTGAVFVSVDYRLAPEHRWPAAVEDAVLAVDWASGHGAEQLGFEPRRVAIGGDSAGGNLAAIAARHRPGALRAQLLVYPALDAAMDSASYRELADFPMLTAEAVEFCWRTYLGDGADPGAPDVSPLRAGDLRGLPPAYVAVAGFDVLRDEGVAYAEALEAAGVPVTLRRYDDMPHGFIRWGGVVDRTHELIGELGEQARAALRA